MTTQANLRKHLLSHSLTGDDDYVLRIDNSSMETMTTCARAAKYNLIEARVPTGRSALTFGSAHHEALEAHYKGKTYDEVKKACLDTFRGQDITPEEWRTPDCALESVMAYIERYKNETLRPTCDSNGLPMVEIPFSIPIGEVKVDNYFQYSPAELVSDYKENPLGKNLFVNNLTIFWTGKIDMIASYDHNTWVLDHKTSSIKGPSYYDDFELSHQTVGYTWAAEKILQRTVDGFLLNLIVNRKPTKTGTGREFDRRPYYYPRYRIDEWPNDTLAIIDDLIHYLMAGKFPPMRKWCVGKYGKCPYHDVCCAPPNRRKDMLHSNMFVPNEWSPLD